MVAALEFAGALQGQQVAGIGDHTDHPGPACFVAADLTEGISGEVEAALALPHLAAGGEQGIREGLDLLTWLVQQMQRQTLGRTRPDAGKPLELIDQPCQGSGETAQIPLSNW